MAKPPVLFGGLALGLGFMSAALRRVPRPVSPELMQFHRNEQMQKLKAIARTLARFRKVDAFSVATEREQAAKGSSRT
jgi:phosphoribosylanthranilate isomerase